MNCFIQLLETERDFSQSGKYVIFVGTNATQFLAQRQIDEAKMMLGNIVNNLSQADYIAQPIISSDHWHLLVVDFHECHATSYNSLLTDDVIKSGTQEAVGVHDETTLLSSKQWYQLINSMLGLSKEWSISFARNYNQ